MQMDKNKRKDGNQCHLGYGVSNLWVQNQLDFIKFGDTYGISANSFRGHYSLFNLALCTVTFDDST